MQNSHQSFGELLSEYMTRTGISDSEMARHLGISRQTIFRWKEGMTARPRERQDVLKCADRLRLTPAERDALLLAAGFAPEIRLPGEPGATQALTTVEPMSLATVEPAGMVVTVPARRNRARWLLSFLLILLAAGTIAAALFFLPNERQTLIALVLPPTPSPTATPLPPNQIVALAQFNSRGGTAPAYDVTARLRQTLEGEIEAQALAGARLADVADQVRDETRAEQLRLRAGAEILVWGNYAGDNVRVEIGSAPRVPSAQTASSVVPVLPRDQSVTLDMRQPHETRALALLVLLPLHLDREGAPRARANLAEAQAVSSLSAEMRAALDFLRGYLLQTTNPVDPAGAVQAYDQNLKTTSLYEAYLNRGLAYLALNEDASAKSDFQRAQLIGSARAEAWRATCWAFALEQQPGAGLPFCEAAATRDATGWSLDTRAIVYAELGRYAEAANEFENFLRWLDTQPAPARDKFAPSRRAWIETLRGGKNPFDAQTLNALRGMP